MTICVVRSSDYQKPTIFRIQHKHSGKQLLNIKTVQENGTVRDFPSCRSVPSSSLAFLWRFPNTSLVQIAFADRNVSNPNTHISPKLTRMWGRWSKEFGWETFLALLSLIAPFFTLMERPLLLMDSCTRRNWPPLPHFRFPWNPVAILLSSLPTSIGDLWRGTLYPHWFDYSLTTELKDWKFKYPWMNAFVEQISLH